MSNIFIVPIEKSPYGMTSIFKPLRYKIHNFCNKVMEFPKINFLIILHRVSIRRIIQFGKVGYNYESSKIFMSLSQIKNC